MPYFIFVFSLGLILFLVYMTNYMLKANLIEPMLKKRFYRLLQFVKMAPIIALLVLLVLVLAYFRTKEGIRLSHAWHDAQFWAYTTFLYCSFAITKHKICIVGMIIALALAVYNTPLFHYESIFIGRNVIVSDIFGILMFWAMWIATSKILRKMKS